MNYFSLSANSCNTFVHIFQACFIGAEIFNRLVRNITNYCVLIINFHTNGILLTTCIISKRYRCNHLKQIFTANYLVLKDRDHNQNRPVVTWSWIIFRFVGFVQIMVWSMPKLLSYRWIRGILSETKQNKCLFRMYRYLVETNRIAQSIRELLLESA